jgi:PAS domain S-box-containing protein
LGADTPPPMELRFACKSGGYVVGETCGAPEIEDGKVTRIFGYVKDATERKRIERALQESEQRYRHFFEAAPIGIYRTTPDGRILMANPALLRMLGYSSFEECAAHNLEVQAESTYPRFKFKEILQCEGEIKGLESEWTKKDGTVIFVRESAKAVRGDDGAVVYYEGTVEDITDRKSTERALRESEERFRQLAENTQDVVWMVNAQFSDMMYVNPAYETVWGQSCESLYRDLRSFIRPVHPEDRRLVLRMFEDQAQGRYQQEEFRIIRGDGSVRWIRDRSFPIRNERGDVYRVAGIAEDITARKHAEASLRESELRYRGLADSAFQGVVVHQDKVIKEVNQAYADMYGYSIEELLGRDVLDLTPPEQRAFVASKISAGVEAPYEALGRRNDGSTFQIEVSAKNCLYDGKPARLAAVRDVTERRNAEEAVRESEERYRSLFERSFSGVYRATLDGRVMDCNQSFARILGYSSREEAVNSPAPKLFFTRADLRKFVGRLKEERSLSNIELRLRQKQGGLVWVLANANLLRGGGEPLLIEGILMDITERKLAEEQLKASRERLQALSTHLRSVREEERIKIAREVHDELGGALTSLKLDLSWLADHLPQQQKPLMEKIQFMSKAVDKTVQAVRRISAELRPSVLDDFGLSAAIECEIESFQNRTGIKCNFTSKPEDILLDANLSTDVFRIFQEALTNIARHANASRVTVELRKGPGYLKLRVKDTGKGIKEREIWDPRSIGLTGMRERVALWGGSVEISSAALNKGTEVSVKIPLGQPSEARSAPARLGKEAVKVAGALGDNGASDNGQDNHRRRPRNRA